MSGRGTQKKSLCPFLRQWWEDESDGGEMVIKNCKEQMVMELSLRLGDVGVTQANTNEERADLVGAESWRVRFVGGGVTWSSTQSILNQ